MGQTVETVERVWAWVGRRRWWRGISIGARHSGTHWTLWAHTSTAANIVLARMRMRRRRRIRRLVRGGREWGWEQKGGWPLVKKGL